MPTPNEVPTVSAHHIASALQARTGRQAQQPVGERLDGIKIQWQQPAPVPVQDADHQHAVFWVFLVVALALMSFYVHVLNQQVHRGAWAESAPRGAVHASAHTPGGQRGVNMAHARQRGQR